jgi:hypothetical protein
MPIDARTKTHPCASMAASLLLWLRWRISKGEQVLVWRERVWGVCLESVVNRAL